MSDGFCTGTYASGGSVTVRNIPVCHDKDHTGKVKEGQVKAAYILKTYIPIGTFEFQGKDDFHYNATLFDCHKYCNHGNWR